jgi:hypothetical protein
VAFDILAARLTCPICGETSPDDGSTEMQTKLRSEPQLAVLRVGDAFEFDVDDGPDAGYYLLRRPEPGEPTRILQTWVCPSCGTAFNWAEVEVREGLLAAIRAVPDLESALPRAHLVDDDARYLVADWLGASAADLDADRITAMLRERAAGRTP